MRATPIILVLAFSSCATTNAVDTQPPVATPEDCAESRAPIENAAKMNGVLQSELMDWKRDSCLARAGQSPQLKASDVAARRVRVMVVFTGDFAALTAAGFDGFPVQLPIAAGTISLRDVGRLAALATVTSVAIEVEPELHSPDAAPKTDMR